MIIIMYQILSPDVAAQEAGRSAAQSKLLQYILHYDFYNI